MPRQPATIAAAPESSPPVDASTPQAQPTQSAPANPDPPTSVIQDPPPVDNGNNPNPNNAPVPSTQPAPDTAANQDSVTSSDTNMAPVAQPQAVMDNVGDGGSPTYQQQESTFIGHRTGLIRPTMSSIFERPLDPVKAVQPGIITASIFVMFGMLAIALVLVRRWRRNRTRRRTRSVINLLNRARGEDRTSADDSEKLGGRKTMYEVEDGLASNNAGVGSHLDLSSKDLTVPPAAKTRPLSIKGFKEGPFPTIHKEVTFNVKFSDPHAPVKPSPLR